MTSIFSDGSDFASLLPFIHFNGVSVRDDTTHSVMTHFSQPGAKRKSKGSHARTTHNTYRLYEKNIHSAKIQHILKEELNVLRNVRYDPEKCRELSTTLSNTIKDRIKKLNLWRYRVISSVYIGNDCNQSINIASKSMWNSSTDLHESCVFHENNLYAVGIVFMVQQE